MSPINSSFTGSSPGRGRLPGKKVFADSRSHYMAAVLIAGILGYSEDSLLRAGKWKIGRITSGKEGAPTGIPRTTMNFRPGLRKNRAFPARSADLRTPGPAVRGNSI